MTTETVPATKRDAQVAALRDFAEWLARNPAMPVPELSLWRHLHAGDGTEAENLDAVRSLAASLGVGTDEHLDDRTILRVKVNEHVWYEVFAWHKGGRGGIGELERLRAEVAELRAKASASRAPIEPGQSSCTCPLGPEDAHFPDCPWYVGPTCTPKRRLAHSHTVACGPMADETGLTYSRADTDADDPTPVSPDRVPLHTGSVVADGVLVTDGGCE